MIPKAIKKLEGEIRSAKPEAQYISYEISNWNKHILNDRDLAFIADTFPRKISRSDIFNLGKTAIQSKSNQDIRRLFLATMIWGYGTTGYGPWRTAKMLATPSAMMTIQAAFEAVANNKVKEAYTHWNIDRCGPPYATKFFYFTGYAAGIQNYPLILDTRVWEALRDRIDCNVSEYVKSSTWFWPEGYLRYIHSMHEWAREIDCEAHNIEYVLFNLGGV